MLSPSIAGFNKTSITLQWTEPPPELTGKPQRLITQYAIKIIQKYNGGNLQVALVPAEGDAMYVITNLQPATTYDIEVNVVIDTEGQGEQPFDLGVPFLTVTTSE